MTAAGAKRPVATRLRDALRQLRSLLLHFAVPVISAAAPLAVIPVVTHRFGADGWGAIAVGLGVGNAGLILAEVGWGVIGPQLVARESAERNGIYERALASKLVAVAIVAPVCALVTLLTAPAFGGAAAFLAAASVCAALSPAWFFVGTGRPALVLLSDTLPRVLCLAGAAVAIALGADLILYGLALLVASAVGLLLAARTGRLRLVPRRSAFAAVPTTIRRQGILVFGRGVSTLYTSLPSAFLGLVAADAVALFAAADRPMRMGIVILGAIPARLQHWIGSAADDDRRHRGHAAIGINAAVGVIAGVVFVVAMPLVAPILFSGSVTIPVEVAIAGGAVVLAMSVSRGLGLALVAADRSRDITVAICCAAAVGVPLIIAGAATHGAVGTLFGILGAETTGVLAQFVLLTLATRRRTAVTA